MKLNTIYNSKWNDWHRVFLWFPKKVMVGPEERKKIGYALFTSDYSWDILWLCYVERRYIDSREISSFEDNKKFVYFKHKDN